MQNYVFSIYTAILVFPFLAFFFTFPYIIQQYRKYGSVLFFKALIVYSFILYLLTIYFLVILPLPDIKMVANLKTDFLQLIPFNFIYDFITKSGFVINDFSSYIKAFTHPSFYNTFFNIIMTIPFGIYLRYYFKYDIKKTILCSFLLSLFFELTQLSGLYGIYPRPYRLFDVDDLITNTTGGLIGYLITPLISIILPERESLEIKAYNKGKEVSYFRRFIAICIDFIFSSSLFVFLISIFGNHYIKNYILSILLYFILIPYVTNGYTIGKKAVKIKIVSNNLKTLSLKNLLIRTSLIYILYLPTPIYLLYIISNVKNPLIFIISIISLFISYCYFSFDILINFFNKKSIFYERFSNTSQISTVIKKEST